MNEGEDILQWNTEVVTWDLTWVNADLQGREGLSWSPDEKDLGKEGMNECPRQRR